MRSHGRVPARAGGRKTSNKQDGLAWWIRIGYLGRSCCKSWLLVSTVLLISIRKYGEVSRGSHQSGLRSPASHQARLHSCNKYTSNRPTVVHTSGQSSLTQFSNIHNMSFFKWWARSIFFRKKRRHRRRRRSPDSEEYQFRISPSSRRRRKHPRSSHHSASSRHHSGSSRHHLHSKKRSSGHRSSKRHLKSRSKHHHRSPRHHSRRSGPSEPRPLWVTLCLPM